MRDLVESCSSFDDGEGGKLILAVHTAMTQMGTFANPLDENLFGISFGEWTFERARRATLAVLEFIEGASVR